MVEERSKNKQANLFGGYSSSSSSKVGYNDDSGAEAEGASDNVFGASGSSAYMSDSDILSIQAPPVPAKSAGRPRENRFPSRVFGWGLGRVGMGWSEPAPVAVWMEMRRVGLAPEGNIPLRCGFDSSSKYGERSRSNQVGSRQHLPSPSPSSPSVFPSPHLIPLPPIPLSLSVAPTPLPALLLPIPRRRRAAGRARELLPRAGRAAPAREQPRLGGAELTAAGR